MPEKLPERILQLAERYQDNFGELNYHIFRPSTQIKFFPSILNMQQAILTSNLFSAIKKEKLCGKFISSYKFIGNYPEEFEEYFHGRGPVVTQVRGYVKAFFYPPHGLSLKLENAIELFVEINDALLGEMSEDNLHIAQWSTEFSQDFINEIWDFCWTVWSQQKKWLLLIYGTSTD